MSDLIKREDALNSDYRMYDAKSGIEWVPVFHIEALPSAEPEQKKGTWIKVGHWGRSYKCNQCGNFLDFDGVNVGRGDANFCPNCGAEMTR